VLGRGELLAGRRQHLSDQVESHLSPKPSLLLQMGLLPRQAWLIANKGTKFHFISEASM